MSFGIMETIPYDSLEHIFDILLDWDVLRLNVGRTLRAEEGLSDNEKLGLMTRLGNTFLNIRPEDRTKLIDQTTRHRKRGGIRKVYDFLGEVERAILDFDSRISKDNLDFGGVLKHANTFLSLEDRFGSDAAQEYLDYTYIASGAGLNIRQSILFGSELLCKRDLDRIVHMASANFDSDLSDYMGEVYKKGRKVYDHDAVKYLLPALLIVNDMPNVIEHLEHEEIEAGLSSLVEFFRSRQSCRRLFSAVTESVFYSMLEGVGENMGEHMEFASASADAKRAHYDLEKWRSFVGKSVYAGLHLMDAIFLSNRVEENDLLGRGHLGEAVLRYLSSVDIPHPWRLGFAEDIITRFKLGFSKDPNVRFVREPAATYVIDDSRQGLFGRN